MGEALGSKEIATPIYGIKLPHANILTFHTILNVRNVRYHNNKA